MTRVKTSRATALPMEAMALRSKPTASTIGGDGRDEETGRRPAAEPAAQAAAGTGRSAAISSQRPAAG